MEKVYRHLGYYNEPDDIKDIFPAFPLEGREADAIVNYMKDGYGNFHATSGVDDEYYDDFVDELKRGDAKETSDGKYIVTFCKGSRELLERGDDMHGFFIDVWECVGENNERLDELFLRANELMFEMKDILGALETFCYR